MNACCTSLANRHLLTRIFAQRRMSGGTRFVRSVAQRGDLGASHSGTCRQTASKYLLRAQAHEAAMAAAWREYQAQYKGLLAVQQARPSRFCCKTCICAVLLPCLILPRECSILCLSRM